MSPSPQALHEEVQTVAAAGAPQVNLARNVYCVLGIPIDAIDLTTLVHRIETAAANRTVLLLSTPNLNFLVNSLSSSEFRESLLESDLCPPDGAPIVWIARLLGLPIRERAAGADLLDRLQDPGARTRRLTVYLFGGAKGVAAAAAEKLNARSSGLMCVGAMDPGFGNVEELSRDHIIDAVNRSRADFLILSLGAKKGQLWLQRNHHRLTIPVRSHLGSAIGYQAGTIKRAPQIVRAFGFEWLWRIKVERYLWKRYWNDGLVLLRLLLTRVLPLAIITRWHQLRSDRRSENLVVKTGYADQRILINLRGAALERHLATALPHFQEALTRNESVVIDLSEAHQIDARFLGLLLMFRKELKSRAADLRFIGASRTIERIFRLNALGFLLRGAGSPPT